MPNNQERGGSESEREDVRAELRLGKRCYPTGFEDGGRGQEPRDAGGLHKLEKSRKQILPWSLQEEGSLSSVLILAW